MLLDPNGWSQDGTVALAEWDVSHDGAYLAYAVQVGGTDWRTIRVMDTRTGDVLDDTVEWARFTSIAWAGEGTGFYYSRYPEPEEGASFNAPISGHAVYFHRLGTAQSDDRLAHTGTSDAPLLHTASVTPDGRFLVIYTSALTGGVAVTVTDLSAKNPKPVALVESHADTWALLENIGSRLIFSTRKDAPRGRVMSIDMANLEPAFSELISERDDAVLREGTAGVLGDRIILAYMVDATTRIERYRLDGTPDGTVALPGPGTTGAFRGRPGDDEAYFAFTSFDTPLTVLRLDVAENRTAVWAEPRVAPDRDKLAVEQRFYASPDGTRIPLFVMRRKDVTGPAPTMLNGYGGFAISIVPYYLPAAMAWVEQGGVYAVANIRGGGEYGSAWHRAGRRAAGGGRGEPAARPVRGRPAVEDESRTLLAYSPLHNIRDGVRYLAILVTTADTDNRVVPAHSFKYAATLQATEIGPRPQLLRVATGSGHGSGKPTGMLIAEMVGQWAFAADWTGLDDDPCSDTALRRR